MAGKAITVEEFRRLKSRVEDMKTASIKAQADYDSAMARLRELGYETLEGAQAALEELRGRQAAAKQALDDGLEAFSERWGDELRPYIK